ncbi:MAG: leucine aminopeptidase-related protein [Myxococcaceae bacterium]|nr:leucine aminopeptidase-related protein [Myxococcaceae bacterium]
MKLASRSAIAMLLVGCISAAACSSSSATTAAPGVVPADLRDVERDCEGLVSTSFGVYPDRKPDWTRATSVLALLKQVWGRGKKANPGMPAAQVKMVDDAIASLDSAIAARDQKGAAYAANKIGLAVPELFDFFHPDAPAGVVRMDAMFRQVGLDGHFNDLAAVKTDLAALKKDWAETKDAVSKRAPTCHRVGGTGQVAAEIEQSFTNLDTALASNDVATVEKESDNGALEIDTLELLFDCPADNAAPSQGLGAKCTSDATCGAGQTCDKANAGGKCAPAASNKIGDACASTVDCGTDAREACATASGDAYPGGYCTMEPCNDIEVCPPGGTCVAIGGESPACFKSCANDDECRKAEGYVCQLFVTQPPTGFGPTDHACAFPCTRDPDCQSPLKCDVPSGKCKP